MIYYFGSKLSDNISETPEGYLICRNVPIARTGKQIYLARELGITDGDPETQIKVERLEEDVFSPVAMASFEGKDVTDGHPTEGVDASNFATYSKGHVQNVRREGDTLVADMVIKDPVLASEVQNRVKREVSCGYICDYVQDGNGGYKQTNIRGNHIAVVPRGRAGHEIAIKDSAPEAQKGAHKMSATKALLEFFGIAAKDATPEELEKLTESTAKVLDADPAVKAPEAEPTKGGEVNDEGIPKGDDLGSKLDKILERIETIEKRINGHGGPKKSSDETAIDEELTKLTGGDAGCEDEDGASEVIEEKVEEHPDKELSAAILRLMRPIVAQIEDKDVKSHVTDALIEAVRGGASPVSDIQKATKETARKAADAAAKTNFDKICEGAQSAYDARNPHMKKEG